MFEIQDIPQPSVPKLERTILGAMLLDPECICEVVNILSPKSFTDPKNTRIYSIIREMYDSGKDIDLHTVSLKCRADKEIADPKISHYLASCTNAVASGAHAVTHAKIIKDRQIQRDLAMMGASLIAKISNDVDLSETLAFVSNEIDAATQGTMIGTGPNHISTSVGKSLKEAERRVVLRESGMPTGIPTGLSDLDKATGGWRGSQLVILAARPAMGKTALMLHFAKESAKQGIPVCIYSLEMSDIALADRLLISESGVDSHLYRIGKLDKSDWQKLEAAAGRLAKLSIYIDPNPVVTMRYIKSHSAIMQKRGQCGMIMVDYLQLADMRSDSKGRTREQEVTETARLAKLTAKELDVPFILLSQLSRKTEERGDKKPQLSDLRESGAIEQDADIVTFIYRPEYYSNSPYNLDDGRSIAETTGLGVLIVAKQREGATGEVLFHYNSSLTKIEDWQRQNFTPEYEEPF